jgi:4'-phosphopantetheinyl transferase
MPTEQGAEATWQPPPAKLSLPAHEIHVWRASLDQPQGLKNYLATLAPDERQRAARLHHPKDREHLIVARGLLRALLGRYLGINPASLVFRYSAHGKPALAGLLTEDVRFNLSHSHGLALLAFARGRDLGIDLEYARREVATQQVAERFFSPAETVSLRALPADQQAEAFFNCWTRKEAYVKARGDGLALRLDQFDVSLAPGEPAMLLGTRAEEDQAARWLMIELAPGADFKAALVVEGRDLRLRCWQWAG